MIYKIKKGRHKSRYIPKICWKKEFTFNIQFLSPPQYISRYSHNQEDINKIYGFSDSWNHHNHSLRIGWYYDRGNDINHLVIYSYVDKVVIIKSLGTFDYLDKIKIGIEVNKGYYIIYRYDTGRIELLIRKSSWWGPRYMLFPYFGGQEKANKNYLIKITDG